MVGTDELAGEAAEPLTVRVFPQDPEVTPEPVPVRVRGRLIAGPVGPRVAVYDYNRERDEVYQPADPDDGEFPDYAPDDFRFHQLNCYGIVAGAIGLTEWELGHDITWPFQASRLIVLPHAGEQANAYYSEDTHSLQFYSFWSNERGEPYHTCLSHDVVAHEAGHAILDAVRSRYTHSLEVETSALHEAMGDLTATFAALSHRVVRDRVRDELAEANLVTEIADSFDGRDRPIRSLIGDPRETAHETGPHARSLHLSRSVYAALVAMTATARATGRTTPDDALRLARTALQRMVVRGLDFLPPADATFADYARAILAADEIANASDGLGFRAAARGCFVENGLLGEGDEPLRDETGWRSVPASWPHLSVRDAYDFLDANRDRLALSTHPAYRDFVIAEAAAASRPTDRRRGRDREVAHVVLSYEYPVDVELKGAEFGPADGELLTIWGGGTLVFDKDARLRFHAEKPVTKERVDRSLDFIRSELAAHKVAIVGAHREDELRSLAAREPRLLVLGKGGPSLQFNAAVRCRLRKQRKEDRR